jgi:hypothetical protein
MDSEDLTWLDLTGLLLRQIPSLRVPIQLLPRALPEWIEEANRSHSNDADLACAAFLQNGSFPEAHGDLKTLLFLRVIFASERCAARWRRGEHRPVQKASVHLLLYLTDTWTREWRPWAEYHFGGEWSFPFDPWSI